MTGRTLTLTDNIYDYLLKYGVREPPILARLREATQKIPDSTMQIGPEQGQFMSLLVKLIDARRCIEVGTFHRIFELGRGSGAARGRQDRDLRHQSANDRDGRQYWREAGVAERIDL